MKKFATIILILVMLATYVPAFAGTENDGPMVGDTLFARPVGLASIGVGAALWVLSFPFAIMSGNIENTSRTFFANPVKYTIVREVGDFDYELSGRTGEDVDKQ